MNAQPEKPSATREPSYFDALLPLVTLVVLIAASLSLFGMDATKGPLQVALLLTSMVTAAVVLKNGHRWDGVAEGARQGIACVTTAILTVLGVGALSGT